MSSHQNTSSDKDLNALSFEDALKELERIVRGLEAGKLSLEDALNAYERGALLRKHCEKRLSEAEMRVQNIVQNKDISSSHENKKQDTPRKKSKSNSAWDTNRDHENYDDEIPF